MALGALHSIHWDLEFSPPTETPKISPLPHAYSEPAIAETLLTRVGSLVRKKSKSKTSHESPPGTSGGHSSSSGSTESPDYQEQAQILHTRIDLTWKFCQRRAYKIKRLSRSRERPTSGASTSRDHHAYVRSVQASTWTDFVTAELHLIEFQMWMTTMLALLQFFGSVAKHWQIHIQSIERQERVIY